VTIFLVDLSDHNKGVTVAQLKAAGIAGMTARAVSFPWNGSTPEMVIDPSYKAWEAAARADSYPFAAYCLFHTYFTPTAQAQFLASVLGDAGIPILLDCEPDSDAPPSIEFEAECFYACKVANLNPQTLYDPRWFWSSSEGSGNLAVRNWRLVSSAYGTNRNGTAAAVYASVGGDQAAGWAAYGGLAPSVYQFGSQIEVGSFLLDGDAFKGTVAELIQTGMFTDWGDPMTLFGQTQVDQLKAIYNAVTGAVDPGTTNLASEVAADLRTDQENFNRINALSALLKAVGANVSTVDSDVKAAEAAIAALPAEPTAADIATALQPLLGPTDAAAVVSALGAAITKGSAT